MITGQNFTIEYCIVQSGSSSGYGTSNLYRSFQIQGALLKGVRILTTYENSLGRHGDAVVDTWDQIVRVWRIAIEVCIMDPTAAGYDHSHGYGYPLLLNYFVNLQFEFFFSSLSSMTIIL